MRRTPIDGNGTGCWFTLTELLKLQINGQFPDESATIKDEQVHSIRPDVLTIGDIKEIELEGRLFIKTRVRTTSVTVMCDVEIYHQGHRTRFCCIFIMNQ